MKFESITMENFMRYKGRNHIEFSCDDVKNVTVVLGDNTVGKTTIAQAFRWGLYGALMANGTKSAGDFQLLNTDILEMMDANSRAKVKVEIAAVDEEKRYIITRETTYTRAFPKLESREFQKKCAMRITELEDMESYVEVDSNEIETLINELFPKNLSHYFLFDGERWNDVSVGGVRENIKESVHILTGLSAYREAKNHLKDMGSNSVIKKFRSEIKGSGAVYDNLEAERKKLERDIEKLRDEIEVLEVNIRNYEKKNEDIERFLAENHNTEELQRKKKHLELLCESQRKQSLYSYKTLVNAISDKAYMVFARSMLRASMELLKSAKMERRDIPYMRQAKDKKIELTPKYEIQMLYRTQQGYREEKNLSEGEKIARNFAFIVTIMDFSRRKKQEKTGHETADSDTLPIVLDGPFSKLGDENIELIAKVLPQVSEQVIIFMLKKDWEYTKLDPYVGSRYYIDKKPEESFATIKPAGRRQFNGKL